MRKLAFVLPLLFLGVAVARAEEKCPISGKPAKAEYSLEVNGKKVSFCCDKCPEVYKKKINLTDAGPK